MFKFFELKLRPTTQSCLLFFVSIIVLSFIAISYALTTSPSNIINTQQTSYDVRLSGISESGWTNPNFSFRDKRIAAWSTKFLLTFIPPSNNATTPRMDFSINSTPLKEVSLFSEKTLPLSLALRDPSKENISNKNIQEGVILEGRSLNPVKSSSGEIGAKLARIELVPRKFLLIPTLNFGLAPFICLLTILLLVAVASFSKTKGKINILPLLIVLGLATYLLSENKLEVWSRAFWIWLLAIIITIGYIIAKFLVLPNIAESNLNSNIELESSKKLSLISIIGILSIFLLGLFLRFEGLDFGLPGYFHPDEGRKMKIARNIVTTGDLNPHYFRHPSFLLYATSSLSYITSKINGEIPELPQVAYLGRSVSATLGSFSILLLFLITRLLFGTTAALVASALFAVAPLHIACSRYIKEDAAMLFFCLASLYFALKAIFGEKLIFFTIISGLFAGFSASSKYSGLLTISFALLPGLNLFLNWLSQTKSLPFGFSWLKNFAFTTVQNPSIFKSLLLFSIALGCLAIGFVVITPYSILDSPKFIFDFIGERNHMEKGHTVAITALSYFWTYHLHFSILPGLKFSAALLTLVACGFLLARAKSKDLLIIAAILLFYLPAEWVKAKPQPQPERYILPCLPFLAIAFGAAFNWLIQAINRSTALKGVQKLVVFLALLLVIFEPLKYSYAHSQSIQNDTRLQARKWLIKNVRNKSNILIDWRYYSAPLLQDHFSVVELKDKPGNKFLKNISAESLRDTSFDYIVLSSFFYGRYLDPLYRSHNLSKRFKKLFEDLQPVATFSEPEFSYGFHNPTIMIFKLKHHAR